MLDQLVHIDQSLFSLLNGIHHPFFDRVMYWVSHKFFWVPLYALLVGWVIWKFKKKSWIIIILIGLLVTTTDQVSRGFKYAVERPRPCRPEANLQPTPHIVDGHCGGKYGFFSSHAANVFGVATFFSFLFTGTNRKKYSRLLFFWAALVSYSRIYLGVHYPLDITCGAILGLISGWCFYKILSFLDRKFAIL